MARITWQNVDAPDLTSALEAQAMGARSFEDAITGIGNVIGSIGSQRQAAANAAALDQMRKYDTVEAWDQAMQQHGISALGIDPTQASEGLLAAIAGKRSQLEGLRTDRRSEEDRARGLEAQRIADSVLVGAASLAGSQESILRMGLDPRLEEATLAAAAGANAANWQLNPGTKFDDNTTRTQLDESRSAIEQRNRQIEYDFQNNPLAKLWAEAPTRYGEYGSVLEGMTERLAATVGDEDQERFGRSKGEVTRAYNAAKAQYRNVPEAIIAAVMEDSLKETGVLPRLWDNKQKFDWSQVHDKLEQFNNPDMRGKLELQVQDYNRQRTEMANVAAALDRAEAEALLLIQKGAPKGEIDKRKAQIAELRASLNQQAKTVSEADKLLQDFQLGRDIPKEIRDAVASDPAPMMAPHAADQRALEILGEATAPEPASDAELAAVVEQMKSQGMSPHEIEQRALQLLGEALAGR